MKKLLSIIFVFLFLFSACKKQSSIEETTTKSYPETSTNKTHSDLTTRYSDITETESNLTQATTENNQTVDITSNTSNSSEENIQNSSPMIIFIGLDELKEVKEAYDSMTADDFQEYMENEHTDTYMTGMWNYENSTALFDELCSTYVPVLDNNSDNLSEFAFYWEINQIDQLVNFNSPQRASAIINTSESTKEKNLPFTNVKVTLAESIVKDNYTINIYDKVEKNIADIEFYAEVIFEDTYIVFRSADIETAEEFSQQLNRLTFVKIGDLLNE